MATVYAMNTLLIHKGVYTAEEFEHLFAEWIHKEEGKKARDEQQPSYRFGEGKGVRSPA